MATIIPDQMKNDNWALYVLARSNNPEIMIPYTRKLLSNLKISLDIAGETKYNGEFQRWMTWANQAIEILANAQDPRGWGKAVINCEAVLDEIGVLVYDPEKRWAITQSGAFKFPAKQEAVK